VHPFLGLMAGSITITGGHGTGAAFGQVMETQSAFPGALALAIAAATFGLESGPGGLLSGWLRQYLTLPACIGAMLVAAIIRNGAEALRFRIPQRTVDDPGTIALSLFLAMVGAFFIDFTNALIITAGTNLFGGWSLAVDRSRFSPPLGAGEPPASPRR
jgi:Na+/glutamate symporter